MLVLILFSSLVSSEENYFIENKLENFSENKCPAKDFKSFIRLYSESEEVQRLYTFSLITQLWVSMESVSEPTPFIKAYKKENLKFPLIPNALDRKSRGLKFEVIDNEGSYTTLVNENAGYRVRYVFLKGACWYLIGIENLSI